MHQRAAQSTTDTSGNNEGIKRREGSQSVTIYVRARRSYSRGRKNVIRGLNHSYGQRRFIASCTDNPGDTFSSLNTKYEKLRRILMRTFLSVSYTAHPISLTGFFFRAHLHLRKKYRIDTKSRVAHHRRGVMLRYFLFSMFRATKDNIISDWNIMKNIKMIILLEVLCVTNVYTYVYSHLFF